jgi:peroxiredoxin Q/BCP
MMKRAGILLGVLVMLFSKAQANELKVGSPAPDFTAPASDGSKVHLTEWLDRAPIVLYFYPKDDTPGCTKEACGIRDNFAAFSNLKVTVFGISYDSVKSHQKFIEKYRLPFLLLSDLDHNIAKAYGAGGIFVASRQTFVIDRRGVIIYVNRSVNPSSHSVELQNFISQL